MDNDQVSEHAILSRFEEMVSSKASCGPELPADNGKIDLISQGERTKMRQMYQEFLETTRPKKLSQAEKKKKRRDDCRRNQQNYRQRQREALSKLEKECTQVRQQNQQLEEQRALTVSRMLSKQNNFHEYCCSTVLKYFQVMGNGISLTSGQRQDDQIEFLQRAFQKNLTLEGGLAGSEGVSGLIDQFVKYTKYHKSFNMVVSDFTACGDNELTVVQNEVETTVILSRESIAGIYPHLLSDEELVQRIIGQKLVIPARTIFYCNSKGQVEKFDCSLDYVRAWTELLGDLDTVVSILDDAKISGCTIEAE